MRSWFIEHSRRSHFYPKHVPETSVYALLPFSPGASPGREPANGESETIQNKSHENRFSPPYPGALPVWGHAQGESETSQDASLDDTIWSRAGRGRAERGVFGDCSIERESGYVPAANVPHPCSESPRLLCVRHTR